MVASPHSESLAGAWTNTHQQLEGLLGRSPHSGSQSRRAWSLGSGALTLREFSAAAITNSHRHGGFKRHTHAVSGSRSHVRVGSAGSSSPALAESALTGREAMGRTLIQAHSSMPLAEWDSPWFRMEHRLLAGSEQGPALCLQSKGEAQKTLLTLGGSLAPRGPLSDPHPRKFSASSRIISK